MYYYKVDKGGNIIAEHEGEERKGWIRSDKKLIETGKFRYDGGKWVEKPVAQFVENAKPVITQDKDHAELVFRNIKEQKQSQFLRLRGELLGYKCNRDHTEQLFALCGVFGEEKQEEAKAWAFAVIELTKDLKRTIEEAKTVDDLEKIELPAFELLRNQVEEIFYRSLNNG
jgi:hypothetical protein